MANNTQSVEQTIWNFLKSQGFTDAGAAGAMGNFYAESGFVSNSMEDSYEPVYGYNNETYTAAINSGKISRHWFSTNPIGYGLVGWTWWELKQGLWDYAKETTNPFDISDLNMQLNYFIKNLKEFYPSRILNTLKTTNSVREASNIVLLEYEKPADQSQSMQNRRAGFAQTYYNKYATGQNYTPAPEQGEPIQINIIQKTSSRNTSSTPNRSLKYIVIHYTAGSNSRTGAAAACASFFATTANDASADFIVDDTTIVQYNPDIRNRRTWHCGGGKMSTHGGSLYGICKNSNSIGIEVCSTSTNVHAQPNTSAWTFTDAVVEQAAKLTKYLMQTYGIPIENVVRHYDVNGKYCPGVIGWNDASGDESKWIAFKNRVSNMSAAGSPGGGEEGGSGATIVQFNSYAARVKVTKDKVLNCHERPDTTSEVVRTYQRNDVLAISKEENGWGYTGQGWVTLGDITKVSISEAIIDAILQGYDGITYDELTGKMIYPLESWNNDFDGGFKFIAHDDLLNQLVEMKKWQDERDQQQSQSSLNTNEFIKNLIISLEGGSENKEQCKEKIQLVLKSAVQSKKVLEKTSSNILIKTAADAFTDVSEEHILEKLDDDEGKKDIIEHFQKTYNDQGWNRKIREAPESLNFWFDFINADSEMGQYAARAIGSRPKAINDDKVTAIYFQETPSVLFLTPAEYEEYIDNLESTNPEDFGNTSGYTIVKLQPFMENYFTISGQGKSAQDEFDSLLYQHTYATDTTTLTSVPIYHLQPNTRVFVKDDNTGINGEYIVNKITVPLQYNGTTSITTTRAVERIY